MLLEREREGGDRVRRRYREPSRPRSPFQLRFSSSFFVRPFPSAAQGPNTTLLKFCYIHFLFHCSCLVAEKNVGKMNVYEVQFSFGIV